MTNKKFKLAAMSMALTACVAAQPLVANATGTDDIQEPVSNINENSTTPESDISNEKGSIQSEDGSTHSSINKTTEADLIAAVKEKMSDLSNGDQLKLSGKKTYTITKNADGTYTVSDGELKDEILSAANIEKTVTEIVKKIASNYINYGDLKAKDIWELLDLQQVYADGTNNQYTGNKGCDSYWPEKGYENIQGDPNNNWAAVKDTDGKTVGENFGQYKTTEFDHLGLDAEVTIEDETGKKFDGLILSEDLTFNYGRKEQIAGYVDTDKYPDKDSSKKNNYDKKELHEITAPSKASLNENITTATGKVWNGTRYVYKDKLVYNYGSSTNAFDGKRFYNISGQVAYDKRGENLTEEKADEVLESLLKDNPNATIVPIQTEDGKTVYNVYANVTNLNALGYMTASANTCGNQNTGTWTPGSGVYSGSNNAGGYELRIQGLRLVNGKVQGNYGVKYSLGLTTIRNTTGSDSTLTMDKTTTTTTKTDTKELIGGNGGTKSGNFSYDYSHPEKKEFSWAESDTKGTGEGTYSSFATWVKNLFNGKSKKQTKTDGSFDYKYSYTTVSDLEAASKTQTVEKHAEADYTYKTIEVKDVDIVDQEVIVITPEEDGDEDPVPPTTPELPPVQDAAPDTPVEPETPVLTPVQDAAPDAPVLPTNAVLPAVQDARALPQTGVNWLAAIGLALSGFSLMVGGAWASLTGKNAKH